MPPGVLAPEAPPPVAVVERPTSVPLTAPNPSEHTASGAVAQSLTQEVAEVADSPGGVDRLFREVAAGELLPQAPAEAPPVEVGKIDTSAVKSPPSNESGVSYPQNAQDIISGLDPDIAGILGHGDVNAGMGKLLRDAAKIQQLGRYGVTTREEAIAHAVHQARALEEQVHEPMRKKYGASLPDKLAHVEKAAVAASRAEAAKLAGTDVELSPEEHAKARAEERARRASVIEIPEPPVAVQDQVKIEEHLTPPGGINPGLPEQSKSTIANGKVTVMDARGMSEEEFRNARRTWEANRQPGDQFFRVLGPESDQYPMLQGQSSVVLDRESFDNFYPPRTDTAPAQSAAVQSSPEAAGPGTIHVDALPKDPEVASSAGVPGTEHVDVSGLRNEQSPQSEESSESDGENVVDAPNGTAENVAVVDEVEEAARRLHAGDPLSDVLGNLSVEQRAQAFARAREIEIGQESPTGEDALEKSDIPAATERPNDANVARLLAGMRDGVSVDGTFSDADRKRAEELHAQAADVHAEIARSDSAASAPDLSGMNPYGEQPPGPWDVGSHLPVAPESTSAPVGPASERHSPASPEPRQRREAIGDMADMVAHLESGQVSQTEAQEQALLRGEGGRAERSAVDRVGEAQEQARVGGAGIVETPESVEGGEIADAAVAAVSEPPASDQQKDQYDAQGNLIRVPAEQPSTYEAEAAALRRPAIIEDAVKRMRAGKALPESLTADEKKQVFAAAEKQLSAEEKSVQEAIARNADADGSMESRLEASPDDDDLSDVQRVMRAAGSGPSGSATESAEQALIAGEGGQAQGSAVDRLQEAQAAARMESAATAPPAPESLPDDSDAIETTESPPEQPLPPSESGTLAYRLENNVGVSRSEAQDPAFQRAYEIALAQAQDVALGGNVDQRNTGLRTALENRVMGFKAPGTKIDTASVVENARRIKIGQERAAQKAKEDTDAVRDFFTPKVSTDPAVTERGSVLTDEQTEEFIDLYSDPDFHLAFAKTSKDASITGKTEEERKQHLFDQAKKVTEQIKADREKTSPKRSPEQQALDRQVRLGKQLETFGLDVNPFDAGFQTQFLAELSRVAAGLKPGVEVDVKSVAQSVVSGYRRENNLPYADMRIIEPNLSAEDIQKREEHAKAYEAKKIADKKAVAEGTFGVVAPAVSPESVDDESGLVVESTAENSTAGASENTVTGGKDELDALRDEEVDAFRAQEAAVKAEKDAADTKAAEIAKQQELEEIQDAAAAAYDKKTKGLPAEVVAKLKRPEGYEKSKEREDQREKAAILISVEEAKQKRHEKNWDEILEQSADSGITPEDFKNPEDAQAFQAALERKAKREAEGGIVDAVADAEAVAQEQQAWNQITELGISIVPGDTPASVRNRINQVMQFAGKPLWESDADTDMFISAAITKATRGEKEVTSVSPVDTAAVAKTDAEKVAQAEQRAVEAEAKVQAMQQLLDRAEAALRAPAPPKDESSVESTSEPVTVPEAKTDEEKQAVALAQQASKAEGEEKKKLVEKVTSFLFGEDGSRRKNVSQGVAMIAMLIMAGVYEGMQDGMKG